MEILLKQFSHCYIRDYKGGKEIRTNNLDDAVNKARKTIADHNLDVEIFAIDAVLKSFSIRQK